MKRLNSNVFEIESSDVKLILKERERDSHKGMFGTVGIMGGSLEYSGAVKLANMSAATLRSGPGIVRVIVPKEIVKSILPYILEQTVYPLNSNLNNHMIFDEDEIKKSISNLKSLAIGMGLGQDAEYEKILEFVLKNFEGSLLIDADGLNTLSKMNLDLLKNTKAKVVLTPHLKEFERLSGFDIDEIKKDSINIALKFAKKYNVIILLKGSTTIVTDGEKVLLVKRGCPGMATAGSGDVLSGILVGLLGYQDANILTVASGAFLAGVAGELAQKKYTDIAMKSSDTIEMIPEAIKSIRNIS